MNDPPITYVTDNERSFGLPPAAHVTAMDQLQRQFPRVGIQPLPIGGPGRVTPDKLGIMDTPELKFIMLGDSGGVKDAEFQTHVATAVVDRLVEDPSIAFAYHVGDEVYFNGEQSEYVPQFYEPYAHFNRPIVGVPGNHDGDVSVDDVGNATFRRPLDTFMANFCAITPGIPACDPQLEYGRHTQTQPYCDWVLNLQGLTIVGVYSNVPSGGHLYDSQIMWLAEELRHADPAKPLILVLHHPPYSVDAHHGGSKHMNVAIERAVTSAGVRPTMVVSGHVHDYQRFAIRSDDVRVAGIDSGNERYMAITPYVVLGNSGYHNLHALAQDAHNGTQLTDKVTFEYGDAKRWGFLVVSTAGGGLSGEYVAVARDGSVTPAADTFSIGQGQEGAR